MGWIVIVPKFTNIAKFVWKFGIWNMVWTEPIGAHTQMDSAPWSGAGRLTTSQADACLQNSKIAISWYSTQSVSLTPATAPDITRYVHSKPQDISPPVRLLLFLLRALPSASYCGFVLRD